MFDLIRVRINHGYQTIKDIKSAAADPMFRGLPVISNKKCRKNCVRCLEACPSRAISSDPLRIDLGKCIFCGDCAKMCGNIKFTNFHKLSSTSRESLIIDKNFNIDEFLKNAFNTRREIRRIFGRSLRLRQISAGGCNGCEMELNACSNVNFDMARFGIEIAASPRHSDGLIITGPITGNMAKPLIDTFCSVPEPKIIIAAGACAISGGIFSESDVIDRSFINNHKPDLFVPGCPVHPLTFINGVINFLGKQ